MAAGLSAAGLAFGPPAAAPAALRWGPLFEALDGGGDDDYVTAVELIYEGYLLPLSREPRQRSAGGARETTLLAGDFFYARGLRLIAARGDADAVGLLARLMAACSQLRSAGAPFADDDALWAYTMGGLAALRAGIAGSDRRRPLRAFRCRRGRRRGHRRARHGARRGAASGASRRRAPGARAERRGAPVFADRPRRSAGSSAASAAGR